MLINKHLIKIIKKYIRGDITNESILEQFAYYNTIGYDNIVADLNKYWYYDKHFVLQNDNYDVCRQDWKFRRTMSGKWKIVKIN